MSNKVRELAEKLAGSSGVGGYKTELNRFERIIRSELGTLLEAARVLTVELVCHGNSEADGGTFSVKECACNSAKERLAVELQGWKEK